MNEHDYSLDPIGRTRFYGIYEATVTNVTDPLKRNRIQVTVEGPTGSETTGWAKAVLPITDSSYHPDHKAHTATQIAALLTTTATTASDPQGGTVSIPALTVVAKSGAGTLSHTHVSNVFTKTTKTGATYTVASSPSTTTDSKETSTYKGTQKAPDGTSVPEHTFHRTVPVVGQKVWVMFIAGDPEYPVWIGVQS